MAIDIAQIYALLVYFKNHQAITYE